MKSFQPLEGKGANIARLLIITALFFLVSPWVAWMLVFPAWTWTLTLTVYDLIWMIGLAVGLAYEWMRAFKVVFGVHVHEWREDARGFVCRCGAGIDILRPNEPISR